MSGLSALDRFEAHVERVGEHHRWTGSPDPRTGTGQFRIDGKLRSTQRASWELHVGPLPGGVRVRSCPDDPACVRVEHLALEPSRREIAPTRISASVIGQNLRLRFGDAFPLYLAYLQRDGRAPATLAVYRSIYDGWLEKPLGDLPVNRLSSRRVATALGRMNDRVPGSAAVAMSILHGMATWVMNEKL